VCSSDLSLPEGAGAFCALGNPESFRSTLSQVRSDGSAEHRQEPTALVRPFQPAFFETFPDHHHYTEAEIEALLQRAPALVTTEKDWLNLPPRFQADGRIIALPIRLDVERGNELINLVTARLRASATRV
jgi:tetraacyldisaccharide-1-P 4'-kinase